MQASTDWQYEGRGIVRHSCGLSITVPTLAGLAVGPVCPSCPDTDRQAGGSASGRGTGSVVATVPSGTEGRGEEGSARLSIDTPARPVWGAWLGIDWMSKAAREGIGGVRLG